jgi:hypothetical protein
MASEQMGGEDRPFGFDPSNAHQCCADECPNAAVWLDPTLCNGDGEYVCNRHYQCIETEGCPALSHFEDCPALSAVGCVDLCVSCSSAVKTLANLQVVGDERHLVPTWMPPGGCTCRSMEIDPACPRCYPAYLICQPCGEKATLQPERTETDE